MGRRTSPERRKRPPSIGGGSEQLAEEITRLLALDVPALRQKWTALLGAKPSPHLGRVLMVRAIAYRLQEKAFSGLKPSAQRILDRVCDGPEAAQEHIPKRRASAGTVLLREWRGVRHRVTVID